MSKHVLIVDHDPVTRNLMTSLLDQRGVTVDQAANRSEAELMLRANHYDTIILDLMLPEENGFRVLEQIGRDFPNRCDHTIVMTSSDSRFVSKLPQDGWCAVLVKPFSVAEFYRVFELCGDGIHAAKTI
jgi:DNA-binding response OmpR family regulator